MNLELIKLELLDMNENWSGIMKLYNLNDCSNGDNTGSQTSPANFIEGGGEGGGEGGSTSGGEDDGYSQAESSIKNGEVIASAQGTKNGGTAQTQVQGTYSGSGSFSASAQTADKERSAQAQVDEEKISYRVYSKDHFVFRKISR